MRGKIEGDLRAASRQLWKQQHVPGYMAGEVRPLVPLLARRDGLVLVDVGANKGFWTKAALELLKGKVAHAYMLDPSPENFRELSRTDDSLLFEPEDFPLISAHGIGAGAEPGIATLFTDEDGSPMASLYAHRDGDEAGALQMGDDRGGLRTVHLSKRVQVAITTLDQFVLDQAIAHIDILKIDTEGHEYDVLAGARATLERGLVDCVFFEFGQHQVDCVEKPGF